VSEAQEGFAADKLRGFIERIQRLEEEKKTIADDIKDVVAAAKAEGYDPKIIKKVLAILKRDNDERLEEESVIDTYLRALGVFNTPPSD